MRHEGQLTVSTPLSFQHCRNDDEETSEEEDDEDMDDDDDTNDSGDDADTIADGDDDNISDDEDVNEDDFWIIMHQLSNDDVDILDVFKGYLAMYNQSKGDVLYLKIMEDVAELEVSGMDFKEALAVAIVKNKEAIKLKISNCGDKSSSEEEELGIWCKFAKKRDDWDSCCKWFLKHDCDCGDCPNIGIPKVVAWFAWVFHLMDKNDLVQKIDEMAVKSDDIVEGINFAVERYQEDILEEVSCDKPKHRGITSVWRYIDDTE